MFALDGQLYASPARDGGTDRLTVYKGRPAIEQYEALVEAMKPRAILELGIYGGGSTALLAQLAAPSKMVAVELRPARVLALDAFIERRNLAEVVRPYYGVDQADTARLTEILADEFDGAPLDLVIDDASHLTDETRISFNALFPHLRPGGCYVIEDWSWPHRSFVSPNPSYRDVVPISALALELVLVAGCDENVIADITLQRGLAILHRGSAPLDRSAFDVASYLDDVGTEMVAALASTRTPS